MPDVPFPVQLQFSRVRIVALVAGGMSFHALDSEGNVHVWGTLDATSFALNSDGFSEPGKRAPTPLKLELPSPIRSISCGRLHASTLDSLNRILTFQSWGRPFKLASPLLATPNNLPVQVECGWAFSAVLTKAGDVMVWWPFNGALSDRLRNRNEELNQESSNKAVPVDGKIQCVVSEITLDPFLLPALPSLPALLNAGVENDVDPNVDTKLIQIGGLDNQLIGLTNRGHVLKFSSLENETTTSLGSWQYLPKFSEIDKVKDLPAFSLDNPGSLSPPTTLRITHVSAHFLSFTAYSTGDNSVVLMGDTNTGPDTDPTIIRELQYKSVISVVLGDYHKGALTSEGKFLTWGQYSLGALGLGDPVNLEPGSPGGFATENQRLRALSTRAGTPPPVETPTEVVFGRKNGRPRDVFCLSAAAAGWHTGVLAIDQEPDEGDVSDEEVEEDTGSRHGQMPIHPGIIPPIMPFIVGGPAGDPHAEIPPIFPRGGARGTRGFRVGFPGRGINRGLPSRGGGSGSSDS